MNTSALVTSLFFLSSPIVTAGELQNLRSVNAEQKRQISSLEKEIENLYSLLEREQRKNGTVHLANKDKNSNFNAPTIHTVVRGDTLSKISREYQVSLSNLMIHNKLGTQSILGIGQKLIIPRSAVKAFRQNGEASSLPPLPQIPKATVLSATPKQIPTINVRTYKAIKGDTFYGIARKFEVSFESLIKANPSIEPAALKIGQLVQIPNSTHSKTTNSRSESSTSARANKTTIKATSLNSQHASTAPKVERKAPSLKEMRPISLKNQMSMQELASQNNTTVKALNALNGWNFRPSVQLAKGSEVYLSE